MPHEIAQVDLFTDKPFAGNPAGVCILKHEADATWMQVIASEMNLSETAFVFPPEDEAPGEPVARQTARREPRPPSALLNLRWFTPTIEVDLCGHATLAAAHVLWETGELPRDTVARFHTRSGELTARRDGEWIEMDFPALAPESVAPPANLLESLGPDARRHFVECGRNRFDHLVELDLDQSALAALRPDIRLLASVDARGIIVTSSRTNDSRFDFISRFFAPRAGIDEDPVTGSAHCALTPWWRDRLKKQTMLAYQASARGGVVRVSMRDDRVLISGQAITVLRGTILH